MSRFIKRKITFYRSHPDLIKNGKIVIKEGDGRKGLKEFAPYDCIHVGACIYQ